jgi:hypothetical protein
MVIDARPATKSKPRESGVSSTSTKSQKPKATSKPKPEPKKRKSEANGTKASMAEQTNGDSGGHTSETSSLSDIPDEQNASSVIAIDKPKAKKGKGPEQPKGKSAVKSETKEKGEGKGKGKGKESSKEKGKKDVGKPGTPKKKEAGKTATPKKKGKDAGKIESAPRPKKPKPVKKPDPPVDPPVFEKVETRLGQGEVEQRIQLREYLNRFKTILSLPERSLPPLDDFDRPITEASVRVFAGAMLDLLKEEIRDEEVRLRGCGSMRRG